MANLAKRILLWLLAVLFLILAIVFLVIVVSLGEL